MKMLNPNPVIQNAAVFFLVNNPPASINWLTKMSVRALADSYGASYVVETPTLDEDKRTFAKHLTHNLETKNSVDIFILGHSNDLYNLIKPIPENLRHKIRFVYNSGCFDGEDANQWLALGAQSYVGHKGESASPIFFTTFQSAWWSGLSLREATYLANQRARSMIMDGRTVSLTETVLHWVYGFDEMNSNQKKSEVAGTRAACFGNCSIDIFSRKF